MKYRIFFLFPFLLAIFLFHYFLVGQAVYGDGIFYWSFARSIVIDHDINVGNEILHHYSNVYNNSYQEVNYPKSIYLQRDKDYRLPIGASVSWIPVMFIASGIGVMISLLGFSVILNGYSNFYQIFVGIENIFFVIFGLYFVYLLLRKLYDQKSTFITVGLLFFASNLLYYGSFDVINSHPLTFFLSSVFVYFFFTEFVYKWYQWLIVGIFVGLLTLTRNQEIVFIILPILAIMKFVLNKKIELQAKIIQCIKFSFFTILGMGLVILPQLLLWQYAYGGLFKTSYLKQNAFDFLHPHILGVLANPQTGLLFTSPIILIGVIGLIILAKNKKYIGVVGFLIFILEYFVIASWASWNQAASYGIRMLISTYPLVAIGLGLVIQKVIKKYSIKLIWIIGAFLIVFNLAMIVRFHLSIKTTTIDMGQVTRLEAQKKLNSIFHTQFTFFK